MWCSVKLDSIDSIVCERNNLSFVKELAIWIANENFILDKAVVPLCLDSNSD